MTESRETGLGNKPYFEHTPVILIADDDPSIRDSLGDFLSKLSYKMVTTAGYNRYDGFISMPVNSIREFIGSLLGAG